MPELPDIVVYVDALRSRIIGRSIVHVRLGSPFLLRTAVPPISSVPGRTVTSVDRIGKRIVVGLDDDYFLVFHLMIAGRLHWREQGVKLAGKNSLAALDFPNGSLVLTEAGTKRRASLHLLQGKEALSAMDPGGIDVLTCTFEQFKAALTQENHTLKRTLTDPRLFSGIGNSYSDEILFHAELSPAALTSRLTDEEIKTLYDSTKTILMEWIERLRKEAGNDFPEKVTAFRSEMAVHGRFEMACRRCGSPVQRIRYADNETNYCARCQTGGKLLSDRALARLLKSDWPKTLDALELMTKRNQ